MGNRSSPAAAVKRAESRSRSTSAKYRLRGLKHLYSFTTTVEGAAVLVNTPAAVDALILASTHGETEEVRSLGMRGLLKLAETSRSFIVTRLFTETQTAQAFVRLAETIELGDEARKFGLQGLCILAGTREITERVFETPGAVKALLNAATRGETNEIKQCGIEGLYKFSCAAQLRDRLVDTAGVVETMLAAATEGETDEMKLHGSEGLSLLTLDSEVNLRTLDKPEIVAAFIKAAMHGKTNQIKLMGIFGLVRLSEAWENQIRLFDIPAVVEAFMDAATKGATGMIRETGLRGLSGLSFPPENKVRLLRFPGVADAILSKVGKSNEDFPDGWLRLLSNITESPIAADAMVIEYNLVDVLLGMELDSASQHVDILARIFFNLAVAPKTRVILRKDPAVVQRLKLFTFADNFETRLDVALVLTVLTGTTRTRSEFVKTSGETLLDMLEVSVQSKGRPVLVHHKGHFEVGRPLSHPLLALRYLTTVSENRKAFGTEWLSKVIAAMEITLEMNDAPSTEFALACLLQYAFDDSTLKILQTNAAFALMTKRIISARSDSKEWDSAVTTAHNLSFKLLGLDQNIVVHTQPTSKNKVMISFCCEPPSHESKDRARQIERFLTAKSIDVWRRDDTVLEDEIMTSMANRVQECSVVIVLVTKSYRESGSCTNELLFAQRLDKKIVPVLAEACYSDFGADDWLGVSIGSLLYYDISNPKTVDSELEAMFKKVLALEPTLMPPPTATLMPFYGGTNTEDKVRSWIGRTDMNAVIVEALVKQGLDEEGLRRLAEGNAYDLKTLFRLDKGAMAVRLKSELQQMFA